MRRAKAVALLVETADAARAFKDLFYRTRLQMLAADALWPQDAPAARAIFRRAWDAATAYDKAEQEAEERETGVPSTLTLTEARDEVLAKVAARDTKLADVLLNELLNEKKDEKSAEQNPSQTQRRTPWRELSEGGRRRLALASELLNRNEPAQASQIMLPVVSEGASGELLAFILRLCEQDAAAGGALYSLLLINIRNDQLADANDVLLVAAPLISPHLLVVVDGQGALQFRTVQQGAAINDETIRRGFYNIAEQILLRPLVPRAEGASRLPDAVALYVAIARLLPHFERESQSSVSRLQLRMSTLSNEIEAGRRESLNAQLRLDSLTPERPGDPLRAQTDQLGRARDAADRDRIALGIVRKAAQQRFWDRARRAAAEIVDINLRRAALSFIALSQVADL
ncbi:MAG: hypothetical protein JO360_14685, partial [Acidobacteria bacterium]|nr:hypothetical protein [Acidobacteriota bacterium]